VRGAERVVFDLDDAIDESQAEPGFFALLRGRASPRHADGENRFKEVHCVEPS
jgi:hypothetical protein